MLRVSVISTDTARYQPVVTILDPYNDEVACGVLAVGKAGAQATATAYVTPGLDGAPATYSCASPRSRCNPRTWACRR